MKLYKDLRGGDFMVASVKVRRKLVKFLVDKIQSMNNINLNG
jgi:hypothetical protein